VFLSAPLGCAGWNNHCRELLDTHTGWTAYVVRLTVVGSSPAWPNPGSAHSGYLVEDTGRLLLDCGSGVLGRLREQEHWPGIDAIAITHFHPDHFGDLIPWACGSRYGPGAQTPKPELFLPPGGISFLDEIGARLDTPDLFSSAFELSEYADASAFRAAGFDVTPRRVPHYTVESYAFRVDSGTGVLAYSGDSGPSDALIDVARGADLFLCEATLLDKEPDPRGHLSYDEAVEVFEAAQAKRLLVTHRPSERDLAEGVEIAYDGLELEISLRATPGTRG
jgi:ribonuclease BN (tRNA processing enzyme)